MEDQLVSEKTVNILRAKSFDFPDKASQNDYQGEYPTQTSVAKYLREEHGIFVLIDVYAYESPGNFYFVPKIMFQRGHKKLYTSFSENFFTKHEKNTWSGKGFNTGHNGSYEKALEVGIIAALKIIK